MKKMFAVTLLFAFAPLLPAQTGEPDFDPLGEHLNLPKQIRVMVEFIEIPLPELTKLLTEPRKSANDTDLRREVQKMVEAGTAKHIETQLVSARSGETATSEAILEYIYPTEYEPAELPQKVSTEGTTHDEATFAKGVATPPTPTAFETRNTGSTLEIQPTLGAQDNIIDLRFAPELVEHVENVIWSEWDGPQGKAPIQMPSFFSQRVNTGLTLLDGQYALASTLSMRQENGKADYQRKLLLFVRADVLTIGK